MTFNQLQNHTQYVDGQLIKLQGPDSTTIGYQYDSQARSFYTRETVLTAGVKHGSTHISTDRIPDASCTTPGLLSAEDKCKLDSLLGTRIGVLGFQGAGFPDDGGWMSGDVILAAGSEMISLERVGQVVRFTVDIPAPFNCGCEECLQIFWLQDETDVAAVRPPTCGGRIPGVNSYGELKVYLFPENTLVNANNSSDVLSTKGQYPSFIFKRYDDGVGLAEGELDMVLKRNEGGTAQVGWHMTPGATGVPECVWSMGLDDAGNQVTFSLDQNSEAGLLGALLYKGSSITKQSGIITGYETDVLSTNRYKFKWWSLSELAAVGSDLTLTNIRQWDIDNSTLVQDSASDVLGVGQIVDVWTVRVGNTDIYYAVAQPTLNVSGLWATIGGIQFGDEIEQREEEDLNPSVPVTEVNDVAIADLYEWGITNLDDPMHLFVDATDQLPASGHANYTGNVVNTLDGSIERRYLEIVDDSDIAEGTGPNAQRPVHVWNRSSLHNAYLEIHLARPIAASSTIAYPPIDILLRAPINTVDSKYAMVTDTGLASGGPISGLNYVVLAGLSWHDFPPQGAIRVIHRDGSFTYGQVFEYTSKLINSSGNVVLAGASTVPNVGSVVELLHSEYTSPAVRLLFDFNSTEHDIQLTPIVGTLKMNSEYSADDPSLAGDNFVKDFDPANVTTGSTYWQDGDAEDSPSQADTSDEGFIIYNGGVSPSTNAEVYNVLRIMMVGQQVWLWWNDFLIANSTTQPYFEVEDIVECGKFGLRLWPGARLRRFIVRSQIEKFSELTLGQLQLT